MEVEQWLFWQMGGVGPMNGQANHFRNYAPTVTADSRHTAYGAIRYTNEAERLLGVLDRRLADREYVAGDYSIADMAIFPWLARPAMLGLSLEKFPNASAWDARMRARPGVDRGMKVGEGLRGTMLSDRSKEAEKARSLLFGQRART